MGPKDPVESTNEWIASGTQVVGGAPPQQLNNGNTLRCNVVIVQSPVTNGNNFEVGGPDNQSYLLAPADHVRLDIDDVSKIYVIAAAGAPAVTWVALG